MSILLPEGMHSIQLVKNWDQQISLRSILRHKHICDLQNLPETLSPVAPLYVLDS